MISAKPGFSAAAVSDSYTCGVGGIETTAECEEASTNTVPRPEKFGGVEKVLRFHDLHAYGVRSHIVNKIGNILGRCREN